MNKTYPIKTMTLFFIFLLLFMLKETKIVIIIWRENYFIGKPREFWDNFIEDKDGKSYFGYSKTLIEKKTGLNWSTLEYTLKNTFLQVNMLLVME